MATTHGSSEPQKTLPTVDGMQRGVARLQKRIDDLETFDLASISKRWDPKTKAVEIAIEETLAAVFGHETSEYRRYVGAARLDHGQIVVGVEVSLSQVRKWVDEGVRAAITILNQAVRGLNEEIVCWEQSARAAAGSVMPLESNAGSVRKVFTGHGGSSVGINSKHF
jgi:hypothetical protein